ncbi:hypothetical protein MC885_009392, partial [Smutsia gigantea]
VLTNHASALENKTLQHPGNSSWGRNKEAVPPGFAENPSHISRTSDRWALEETRLQLQPPSQAWRDVPLDHHGRSPQWSPAVAAAPAHKQCQLPERQLLLLQGKSFLLGFGIVYLSDKKVTQ